MSEPLTEADIALSSEDRSIDLRKLLAACIHRIRNGWDDLPLHADAPRTIAAVCRRALASDAEVARLRDYIESYEELPEGASPVEKIIASHKAMGVYASHLFDKLADKDAEIARLQGEAELYRRGYEAMGAADISEYLALCGTAREVHVAALNVQVLFLELLHLRRYDDAARLADSFAAERFEITRSWTRTPYLTRWAIQGKRSEGDQAVYLHRFQRSDADEPHNHPWPFTTIILAGGYYEQTPDEGWSNGDGPTKRQWYAPGSVLHRPAAWIHSVQIPEGAEAWTLVLRGKKEQSWGFYCPKKGFVPWRDHLAAAEATGNGCGG